MVATPRSPLTIGKSFFIPAIMYEIVINGKKKSLLSMYKKTPKHAIQYTLIIFNNLDEYFYNYLYQVH